MKYILTVLLLFTSLHPHAVFLTDSKLRRNCEVCANVP